MQQCLQLHLQLRCITARCSGAEDTFIGPTVEWSSGGGHSLIPILIEFEKSIVSLSVSEIFPRSPSTAARHSRCSVFSGDYCTNLRFNRIRSERPGGERRSARIIK